MPIDMPDDSLTTPEGLQRRVTLITGLTGAALCFWFVPIALVFAESVHPRVFMVTVSVAACLSMTTVLAGVVIRAQRKQACLRRVEAAQTQDRHDEQMRQNRVVVEEAVGALIAELQHLSAKAENQYWRTYRDVVVDLQGGPEKVAGETTQRIERMAGVVPLSRTNGVNGRH